jgi:hypothetical protein
MPRQGPEEYSVTFLTLQVLFITLALIVSATLLAFLKFDHQSLFDLGPSLLSLVLSVVIGMAGGYLFEKMGYPPMLGMLLTGIVLKNVFATIIIDLPHLWLSKLWTLSLTAVISRSGLSMKASSLRSDFSQVLILGSVPMFLEALFLSACASQFFRLPTPWACLFGFGIASISPGVVLPLLLNLMEKSTWKKSKLPIMIAATGLDVLLATTGFGVSLAAAFKHHHAYNESWIIQGMEEILLGLFVGIVLGGVGLLLGKMRFLIKVHIFMIYLASAIIMGWVTFNLVLRFQGKVNGMSGVSTFAIIIAWAIISNSWDDEFVKLADAK